MMEQVVRSRSDLWRFPAIVRVEYRAYDSHVDVGQWPPEDNAGIRAERLGHAVCKVGCDPANSDWIAEM